MLGALAVYIAGHADQFPFIPTEWQKYIEAAAVVYGMFAAKMATSPLPGKHEL
jgi:hypothetical protein